jgi:tripartite ATP-independent transporter DctM subunit
MATTVLFGVFFLLLLAGMPIVFAMAIAALALLVTFGRDLPLTLVPHQMVAATDSFLLLAVPLFFLAGELMNAGGITHRLVRFAGCLVGHIRGGLAYVVIVSSMIMSGFSGSAVADASAVGSVLIPSMKRQGYHPEFAAAVTAAAATSGPIIPPSIPMVIFAAVAETSLGALFLAGMIPGLIMGAYLMGTAYGISRRRGYPTQPRAGLGELGWATVDAFWSLLAPVVVLGGILAGVVTPTEAAALAVFYALVVGVFVHRELRWRDLPALLRQSVVATGVVMIIVAASGIMAWEVANLRVGEQVVSAIVAVSSHPWFVLVLVNVFFLVVGCVLDPLAAMIIFVPVLLPLVRQVGIDLTHFGLVVVLNLTIGLLTPPVGYLLYVSSTLAGVPIESVVREGRPFLIALLVVLVLCTYWPAMVLWAPRLVYGGG